MTYTSAQAAKLLHSDYGRAAVAAYVQNWLGENDIVCTSDIPLENDRDYVMSLLALLAGGSKRSEFSVEELGGECRRNGYAIPQMQFSRKEKEK